MSSLLQVMIVI